MSREHMVLKPIERLPAVPDPPSSRVRDKALGSAPKTTCTHTGWTSAWSCCRGSAYTYLPCSSVYQTAETFAQYSWTPNWSLQHQSCRPSLPDTRGPRDRNVNVNRLLDHPDACWLLGREGHLPTWAFIPRGSSLHFHHIVAGCP